jgi:hypothetical protein
MDSFDLYNSWPKIHGLSYVLIAMQRVSDPLRYKEKWAWNNFKYIKGMENKAWIAFLLLYSFV